MKAATSTTPLSYHVLQDRAIRGPYTKGQILNQWEAGLITTDAQICVAGSEEWQPALGLVKEWKKARSKGGGSDQLSLLAKGLVVFAGVLFIGGIIASGIKGNSSSTVVDAPTVVAEVPTAEPEAVATETAEKATDAPTVKPEPIAVEETPVPEPSVEAKVSGPSPAAPTWQVGEELPDMTISKPGGTQEIHEVTLVKVEVDGVRVKHAAGIAKVPTEDLPEEIRARFGLTIKAAQEHRDAAATVVPTPLPQLPEAPPQSVPARNVRLYTMEDVKRSWLAQCDPNTISPLDREVAKKRSALQQRAKTITSGRLDLFARAEAHKANAAALSSAGHTLQAAQESAKEREVWDLVRQVADRERARDLYYEIINGHSSVRSVGGGR